MSVVTTVPSLLLLNTKTTSFSNAPTVTSPSAIINLNREPSPSRPTPTTRFGPRSIPRPTATAEGLTISHVLHPNRASVEEILRSAPATHMTRLVSSYLDSSEHTSRLCLSLRESINQARSIYSPIGVLLGLIPSNSQLTSALCDLAFDTFVEFNRTENPFPSPSTSTATNSNNQFEGMRDSFIGLVLATHAMTIMLAGSAFVLGSCGLFAIPRLKDDMDRLDTAARNTYVFNNDLCTIES
ncbi:hypothetical protein LUZ60_005154 [Juncus effusus]|nr:hypothetical protein LUZ60_005154 [Juncus effusus]